MRIAITIFQILAILSIGILLGMTIHSLTEPAPAATPTATAFVPLCICQQDLLVMSATPTSTMTSSPTPYVQATRTRTGSGKPTREPTFTPRPPMPTVTPYYTPAATRTPTFVPTTQIPPLLAHWHLKNDNAKLWCVYSEKGHKPNVEWYVDYNACVDAAK